MLIERMKSPLHPTQITDWVKLGKAQVRCLNHSVVKCDYSQAALAIMFTQVWYWNQCELFTKWLQSTEQYFAYMILFPILFQGFSWLKDWGVISKTVVMTEWMKPTDLSNKLRDATHIVPEEYSYVLRNLSRQKKKKRRYSDVPSSSEC